jgi:hypothetical protein
MFYAVRAVLALGASLLVLCCTAVAREPLEAERSSFNSKFLFYDDGVLLSLKNGEPTDAGSGNFDHVTSIPENGVIRLGLRGECEMGTDKKGAPCRVRNEIGVPKDRRPHFTRASYYAVNIRLSEAAPGAENTNGVGGGEARLMIAQLKFVVAEDPMKVGDFSPILALRYEDDLLYITTEFMGKGVPLNESLNNCRDGFLATLNAKNDDTGGPYRVLLASEEGRLPQDFDTRFMPRVFCLKEDAMLDRRGCKAFPRQPRDRFFRFVASIDGGTPSNAKVRFGIGDIFIASLFGVIGPQVTASETYFKFGPYGDLPRDGRKLSVDYSDYRQAPSFEGLGFGKPTFARCED